MIKNTMPNKSGNPERLKTVESSSTNMHIVGEDLLRAFYKLFCLQFCVSSDHWKNTVYQRSYKEFERHMKIIVTIIPANLVANSLLPLFRPFVETKNKNQIFA